MVQIFTGIRELLSLQGAAQKQGRHVKAEDLTSISDALMVAVNGVIEWVGAKQEFNADLYKQFAALGDLETHDLQVETLMPAFVECHTHLVFAGNRAHEFELRNQGLSYNEIARQGGGILYTVEQTRKASQKDLQISAQKRTNQFVRQGVTTLEVKSGYALDLENEIKCLEVIRQLKGPRIVSTFLGAHAIPPEFSSGDLYINYVIQEVLPEVAKRFLADRVDVFCEQGYFSPSQTEHLYQAAQKLGLALTGHMEQITTSGGSVLAGRYKAQSCDHIVQITKEDIEKLAASETTGVLLPGADLYLKMNYPPARDLIDSGVRVALATDFNPGSCPTQDLSLIGLLARLEMKMTLPEVIAAYTLGGAYALGLGQTVGSLEKGKECDFICLDGSWKDLFYQVGKHPVSQVWRSGTLLDV